MDEDPLIQQQLRDAGRIPARGLDPPEDRQLELVNVAEIGRMLGVSRQRAHQIVDGASFPEPAVRPLARGRLWDRRLVIEWIERTRGA